MLWALVPVKELSQSKQRLARVLDPVEREGLVLAMLRDVLTAIQGVSVFDGVLLVSRSSKARSRARDFGIETFAESVGADHSQAVTEKLENPHQLQMARKDIARVLTLLNGRGEKDLEPEQRHRRSVAARRREA